MRHRVSPVTLVLAVLSFTFVLAGAAAAAALPRATRGASRTPSPAHDVERADG